MTRRPRPPVRRPNRGRAASRARGWKAAAARKAARARIRRTAWSVVVVVVLLGCLLVTLDRIFTPGFTLAVVAIVLVAYAFPAYLVCLVSAVVLRLAPGGGSRGRRWWSSVAVVAALGAALHAFWLSPAFVGNHPSREPTLTVLQLNTRFGLADPRQVAQLAAARDADVVVLEELNPKAASRLGAAGLGQELPHRWGDARAGTMVFSRWPLRNPAELPVSKGAIRVRVGATRPFWLIGLHTTQPLVSTTRWQQDLSTVRQAVLRRHGPGIVVGDFNATLNHGPMRHLLGTGLRDAAQAGNSGWQPTWPSDHEARVLGIPIPVGLFTLDHVLVTPQIDVVSTRTITVGGTDHKALVASLIR